jgi:hypothetical protein
MLILIEYRALNMRGRGGSPKSFLVQVVCLWLIMVDSGFFFFRHDCTYGWLHLHRT